MPYILRVSRREPRGRSRPARYVAPVVIDPVIEPEPEPIEVELVEEVAPRRKAKAEPEDDADG